MYRNKPVIGIVGGIGSGKSYVAQLFGELGSLVIDSDAQVRAAYQDPAILSTLQQWWGDEVFHLDGSLDRAAVARRVFNNPADRQRLESLVHPWVDAQRTRMMDAAPSDVVAFVWDTPLLMEAGLHERCDALVFVDAPRDERLRRVREQRGWDEAELQRRENLQLPLDRKREISDYQVVNTAGAEDLRGHVRQILSRIVTGLPDRPGQG
jgi:dephospho-CoA kinase